MTAALLLSQTTIVTGIWNSIGGALWFTAPTPELILQTTGSGRCGFAGKNSSGTTLGEVYVDGANGNVVLSPLSGQNVAVATRAFASLGTVPAAGMSIYCTDCTTAATCAGAGTGHLAVSNATNWTCQ